MDTCFYCKSHLTDSTTTKVVEFKDNIIIIKHVPCKECEKCGAVFYTDEIMEKLERLVSLAKQLVSEITVLDFEKAT